MRITVDVRSKGSAIKIFLSQIFLIFASTFITAQGIPPNLPKDKDEELFKEGSIWTGFRYISKDFIKIDMNQKQMWGFTIDKKDKNGSIVGEVTLHYEKTSMTIGYKGKVIGKTIRFTTDKKGFFQQSFEGKIADGVIAFAMQGFNGSGQPIRFIGTAKEK